MWFGITSVPSQFFLTSRSELRISMTEDEKPNTTKTNIFITALVTRNVHNDPGPFPVYPSPNCIWQFLFCLSKGSYVLDKQI